MKEKLTFTKLEPNVTGVNFINKITESGIYNHIAWENVYHGAGVAIGDINNDGLSDLFFSGNMNRGRLYLNKGDMKFEDISKNIDFPKKHYWSNGVSMVDINSDGFLDIYINKSGFSPAEMDRKNLLFVNNKNLTFTEQAEKYGLADMGFSIQTAFFDMDNDGDLDAYVMNQPPSTRQEKLLEKIAPTLCESYTDRLLRNDINITGKFTDITLEAGVDNCAYGLGLVIVDINEDGWNDIYVSNDYFVSDHLYINQKNGTFKDESKRYFKHLSLYAMGCDVADFNNDGYMDFFTADMSSLDHYREKANMPSMNVQRFANFIKSGEDYQYMFNTLQLNMQNGTFSEVAQLAGVSSTDWSWGSLWVDVENDGDMDLFVTNGIKKEVRNIDALNELRRQLEDGVIRLSEILKITPSEKLPNYAFENKGKLRFETNKTWGFDEYSFSNGISTGDLDNDGDMDIVVSNVDDYPSILRNDIAKQHYLKVKLNGQGDNTFGYGTKVKAYYGGKINYQMLSPTRGYLSSVEPILHFGLGKNKVVDSLLIIWQNGKIKKMYDVKAGQTLEVLQKDEDTSFSYKELKQSKKGTLKPPPFIFKHKEEPYNDYKDESLLPYKLSQLGPCLAKADVNKDGYEDFFIGGGKGQAGNLYLQYPDGFKLLKNQPWSSQKEYEEIGALFFDFNDDGFQDLYIASGSYQFADNSPFLRDRLFLGDKNGEFAQVEVFDKDYLSSTKAVVSLDYDNDGDLDLFVGGRVKQKKYGQAPKSYFFENKNGKLLDVISKVAPDLEYLGMVTDATAYRDKNNKSYLIVVGEWMPITFFELKKKKLIKREDLIDKETTGLWFHVNTGDFDNDGDIDIIAGNLGKNSKYKIYKKNSFYLFVNDFDGNGSSDIVLAKENQNVKLPIRGKSCSSQQMPFINKKFKSYHEYASATLNDIYGEKLNSGIHKKVSMLRSVILVCTPKGTFEVAELPIEAQFSPIMATVIDDLNKDGKIDIACFGNLYETEVETTRLDASEGIIITHNEDGYKLVESCLGVEGNTKSAVNLKGKGKNYIIVGVNDGASQTIYY